jgi:hypothetical protein
MKPPFKLVIQRKPAELQRDRTFRGVPQAGGQQSAFVLFLLLSIDAVSAAEVT